MEQRLIRKNLQHIHAVITAQRAELNKLVPEILKLNGYVFWAEQRFARIVTPFAQYEGRSLEVSVSVDEEHAARLDGICAELRVHVETVKTYLVFLNTAQSALKKLAATKSLLSNYKGGAMPGKGFTSGKTDERRLQGIFHELSNLPQALEAQIRALREALELCASGKIIEAMDGSEKAFVLVATVQSLAKGLNNQTIALLPSNTIQ